MRMPRLLWVALLACGLGASGVDFASAGVPGANDGTIDATCGDPGAHAVAIDVTCGGPGAHAVTIDATSADPGVAVSAAALAQVEVLDVAFAGQSLGVIRADAADEAGASGAVAGTPTIGLSAERAQLLLRSLTMPGWAQASTGHRKSAMAFALAEVGVWTSFTAFRIQSHLRKQTSETTAMLFAGVDLSGRDEEYRRIVGSYISSDEYNQLVVYRDAANLYYDDPVAYRAYIAGHLVDPADQWSWNSDESLLRYRAQRKDAQRASIRANTALACAVVNRLLSMVHAARIKTPDAPPRSWNFEVTPAPSEDAFAYRMGVRARF